MKAGNLVRFTYGSNTFVVLLNSDTHPYSVTHVEKGINKIGFHVPLSSGIISTSDFVSEVVSDSSIEMTKDDLLNWRLSGNGEIPTDSVIY